MTDIDKYNLIELQRGSYKAYTHLYYKWAPSLFRFVFSLTKSKSVTDDIVQETFVKVWMNHRKIEVDKSFKAYLFTISYHRVIKELRYQVNQVLVDDFVEFSEYFTSSEQPASQKMDYDSFLKKLDEAKNKLTPRQKEIFELNKEQEFSVKEISSKLRLSEQSVRNQLSFSLKILRQELEPFYLLLLLFFCRW